MNNDKIKTFLTAASAVLVGLFLSVGIIIKTGLFQATVKNDLPQNDFTLPALKVIKTRPQVSNDTIMTTNEIQVSQNSNPKKTIKNEFNKTQKAPINKRPKTAKKNATKKQLKVNP